MRWKTMTKIECTNGDCKNQNDNQCHAKKVSIDDYSKCISRDSENKEDENSFSDHIDTILEALSSHRNWFDENAKGELDKGNIKRIDAAVDYLRNSG